MISSKERTKILDTVAPILKKAAMLEEQLSFSLNPKDSSMLKTKGQEYTLLQPFLPSATSVMATLGDLNALEELIKTEPDASLQEEQPILLTKLAQEWQTFQDILKRSKKKEPIIASFFLEIRAGTGGEEASLFCGDLFRMYHRYSQQKKWSFEVIGQSLSERGGYREVIVRIRNKASWEALQYEAGVHRVQRVPVTESGGRIHTSTATVAILPEPQDTEDLPLPAKDLRIEVFRARGPGGQSVNTTDSAVRITHLPTGIVVSQQDEKSQHRNKAKALAILRARLYEHHRQLQHQEQSSKRAKQIGTGERCERIRTYNFPQGRITDHRAGFTSHQLEKVINGEALDGFLTQLKEHLNAEHPDDA